MRDGAGLPWSKKKAEPAVISLGAQHSGEDDRTMPLLVGMRRALKNHCTDTYCDAVEEFALVMRVGGEMNDFDFEGCQRLRFARKSKYMTVDIGFPSAHWKGRSDQYIKTYIANAVLQGVQCCLDRLDKEKLPSIRDRLLRDFEAARSEYLGDLGS